MDLESSLDHGCYFIFVCERTHHIVHYSPSFNHVCYIIHSLLLKVVKIK